MKPKLTKEQIKIRNDKIKMFWKHRKSNMGFRYVGEMFGLSAAMVSKIINKKYGDVDKS